MEHTNPQLELIRGFLLGSPHAPSRLAKMAGLHANTLRDFKSPGWNPTNSTIVKLLSLMAQNPAKASGQPSAATIPANTSQIKAISP